MTALVTSALHRLPVSAAKTATYAVMHFCVAASVAYALTGSVATALSIGLIEPFVQTFFYNLHERMWSRIPEAAAPEIGRGH